MSSATTSLRSSPGLTPSSDSTHFHYTHSSINLASLPGNFASSNGSRDNVGRPSDSTGFHDGQDQNHQGLQTALQRMGLTDRSTGGSDNPPQLPPDFSFKPSGLSPHAAEAPVDRSQTGSRNEGYSPLDDFRFPASTFDSPVFPHASYATSNGQDGSRSSSRQEQERSVFESSILKAPQLPSVARFESSNLDTYTPPFQGASSNEKQSSIGVGSGAKVDTSREGPKKEGLKIISSPKRDAYEIAAEQSRLRAGVGLQAASAPVEKDEAWRSMNSDQLSQLTQDQLAVLIENERARRHPATKNYSMHSDAFRPVPPSTDRPSAAPVTAPLTSPSLGDHARSRTAPVVAPPLSRYSGQTPSTPSFIYSSASGVNVDQLAQQGGVGRGLGIGTYFDPQVTTPAARNYSRQPPPSSFQYQTESDRQKQQLASFLSQAPRSVPYTPSVGHQQNQRKAADNVSVGGGGRRHTPNAPSQQSPAMGTSSQLTDLIAALSQQADRGGASYGHEQHQQGFAVNIDGGRPRPSTTFAPGSSYGSTIGGGGSYSPGLGDAAPSQASESEMLTQLQAIRYLHPGVFGNHSTHGGGGDSTPSSIDANVASFSDGSRPTSSSEALALASILSASGLGHGINPAVLDPDLQRYLIAHNLPLDGPSPTNKKAKLYKTEKCRSWEKNVNATTPEERCQYGNKCQLRPILRSSSPYAHGEHELRPVERHPKYKTQICTTFWLLGQCAYGRRCCFLHNDIPAGGIPELGDLGTQEALRSILKARLTLVGMGSQLDNGVSIDQSSTVPQSYFQSGGADMTQLNSLAHSGRYTPSYYESSRAPSTRPEEYANSFRSTYARTANARAASPYSAEQNALLRPRDRSDSLSVNFAPVPELTPIPPSLPSPYDPARPASQQQRFQVPGTPNFGGLPIYNVNEHKDALAAVQAAHARGAYNVESRSSMTAGSNSPRPTQDPALGRPDRTSSAFHNPWSTTQRNRDDFVGAIGDRSYAVNTNTSWAQQNAFNHGQSAGW